MKQVIIVSTLFLFFSLKVVAQANLPVDTSQKLKLNSIPLEKATKFCVVEKSGKIYVTADGKVINADVTLKDGSRLTTGGSLIKNDGSVKILKSGDCIDKNGVINEKSDTQ